MNVEALARIASTLVADGKGILAADESTGTIKKRFEAIGIESTAETRRLYRELLFTTAGAAQHIGGVIFYDETLRQNAADGRPFPKLLADQGIVAGIKVDRGAMPLAGASGETVTEGLDGLRERLNEYYGLGARFTKWRAVITIGDGIPSAACVHVNAHALGRYAALSQEAGLVPIVEPEVLMDGSHGIERCNEVTDRVLEVVFHELGLQRVALEGMLLKPNMVIHGQDAPRKAGIEEVAQATVRCLRRHVPAAVPGVVFLSGGQTEEEATAHLNAMNQLGAQPWALTFSYGRALQASALAAWGGVAAKVPAAQRAFAHRAQCNAHAALGRYTAAMERGEARA